MIEFIKLYFTDATVFVVGNIMIMMIYVVVIAFNDTRRTLK